MCCKHYLDLIEIAWKSNHIKKALWTEFLDKWKSDGDLSDGKVFCKNCGEAIDFTKFSET